MVEGPLSLQSEWGMVNVDRKTKRNSTFAGGYIQGGYMLTDDVEIIMLILHNLEDKAKKSIMEGGIEHGKLLQEQVQWI